MNVSGMGDAARAPRALCLARLVGGIRLNNKAAYGIYEISSA
jgi:hypothetical protein